MTGHVAVIMFRSGKNAENRAGVKPSAFSLGILLDRTTTFWQDLTPEARPKGL
jgi:hypothetical protein